MNREWLFIHGWGYGADTWTPWLKRIAPGDLFHTYDRGYFGQPVQACFTSASHRILVTHSMGLLFYDPSIMGRADHWVVIGGFDRFHGQQGGRRMTARMRARLGSDPSGVVREFRERCGDADPRIPETIEPRRLIEDLTLLDEVHAPISLMRETRKMSILHARSDAIVPLERASGLGFPLHLHPDGTHALPFTHTDWCWTSINPF